MSQKKLLDQVREQIRVRHYSIKTERTYIGWIKRYILFHQKKHTIDIGKVEIEAFLIHLAVDRKVSATTRKMRTGCFSEQMSCICYDFDCLMFGTAKPTDVKDIMQLDVTNDHLPIALSRSASDI